MIRVAIASGHTLLRQGLAALLTGLPDIELVAHAGNPQDLRAEVEQSRPDVVLLDPRLPGGDVVEVIRHIAGDDRGAKVLVVDRRAGSALSIRALRAGAHGLLDGKADLEELSNAVREVHNGKRHLPSATQATLAEMYLDPSESASPADLLSEREFQVMCLLASGASSREAAERLSISVKTVDSHRGNLLKKLGLRNNADLARFALAHGYVEE